jgi:hypothetical protein
MKTPALIPEDGIQFTNEPRGIPCGLDKTSNTKVKLINAVTKLVKTTK